MSGSLNTIIFSSRNHNLLPRSLGIEPHPPSAAARGAERASFESWILALHGRPSSPGECACC